MSTREQLEQSLAALEAQRATLGDEVVDPAIAAIRAQLSALEPAPEPDKQRKQATLLFADVSGFTAMSESMDHEDVQEMMNALWDIVDEIILEHNGHIDKHIGDAVMALWGSDVAREDDPRQGVKAALAMQSTVRDFAAEHKLPLKMRIGLNTGPVLLGAVGSTGEFTAMGDAVNIASRLEHAAPVGGVLISHDTYRHVRGHFEVEGQEPLTVKGKSEPLRVYLVRQAKPRAFDIRTRGVEGVQTRTIGRDAEVKQLWAAYESATGHRQTTVVTIVGDAGVGKSRLLRDFERGLEQGHQPLLIFKGRASPQTRGIPHYLLRDSLANRFQILASDSLDIMRHKLVAGISEYLADEGEMKAHILGTWLGYDFSDSPHLQLIKDDPKQIKNRATLYLAQFFSAVSQDGPAVVLLEDIHWADGGSLDDIVDLVRRRPGLPLCIVCLARPSLLERRPGWGENLPVQIQLHLSPLSAEANRALAAELLQLIEPAPEQLLNLVSSRAEGNPFFAEELVNMLIDDGVIVTGAEAWHVAPEGLLEVQVPATLTGVLQARLDRLGPGEKRTIQSASVVGRIFWDKALVELRSESPPALPVLQTRAFIFPRGSSAFEGTKEFIFKHSLQRDVIYETVLKRVRRRYHGLVADWLVAAAEANGRADEYAAVIGEHYHLAEQLSSAAVWYGRAGQSAARAYAHDEAIHYLSLSLSFIAPDDVTARFDLLGTREKAYHLEGDRQAQGDDLDTLMKIAAQLNPQAQATVALRQADFAEVMSEFEGSADYARTAVQIAEEVGDRSLMAEAYGRWGRALRMQGLYPQAIEQFQAGLQLAQEVNAREQAAFCLYGLGNALIFKGEYATAQGFFERALAIYRELGDRQGEGVTFNSLGITFFWPRDYGTTRQYHQRALAIQREIGDRWGEGMSLHNLGEVTMIMGDYATAQAYLERSLSIARQIDDRLGEAYAFIEMGRVSINQGDYATAQEHLENALAIAREVGARLEEGWSHMQLGAVFLAQSRFELAETHYQKASTIFNELDLGHFLVESWAGLAQAWLALGDLEKASRYGGIIMDYLSENPTLEGTEDPIRTLNFTWEVWLTLDQPDKAHQVLVIAADLIQAYLDANSDPHLQEMYLSQPDQQALWRAWLDTNE